MAEESEGRGGRIYSRFGGNVFFLISICIELFVLLFGEGFKGRAGKGRGGGHVIYKGRKGLFLLRFHRFGTLYNMVSLVPPKSI